MSSTAIWLEMNCIQALKLAKVTLFVFCHARWVTFLCKRTLKMHISENVLVLCLIYSNWV